MSLKTNKTENMCYDTRTSSLANVSTEEQEEMFNEMVAGAASPPLPPIDDDELDPPAQYCSAGCKATYEVDAEGYDVELDRGPWSGATSPTPTDDNMI